MDHVAIMRKSLKLTDKILTGQKKIESRWYKSKCAPWERIKSGDTVYFKNSGEPVTLKADVDKVLSFPELTPNKVKEILREYGKGIGLGSDDIQRSYERVRCKRYCILIFLKNPKRIEPFKIDKTGYGLMSAWIITDDINKIKN